jgi:hypothetical protein
MNGTLQDAIADLVNKAQSDGTLLRVAAAAEKLARQHGADSREIAALIIDAGAKARINMLMDVGQRMNGRKPG